MTRETRADDWTTLPERLEARLAQAASCALVDNLAAALKQTVAEFRSDRPADVAELRHEFKTGLEGIRKAYRADTELVVLKMRDEMRAAQLEAEREYRVLSQQALAAYQPFVARRAAR